MTDTATATSLSTRLRLRELAQYYSATSTLPESDFSAKQNVDGTIRPYDLADFEPYVPELSKDPSLTAIAQLAAVRLNCQRSFISLIAESSQHVVAEATRTVSPFDKDDFEGDDAIILGAQSIPLTFGICTTTIGVFTGSCPRPFGGDTIVQNDFICIPDLLAEDNTSSLPAIQALPPILRFYLEVPLLSESGYVIGSICVMDPTVKKVDLRDVKILQDMSKLAMRHLELIRMKADHARAESLLQGLGHFIKGQDSIQQRKPVEERTRATSTGTIKPRETSVNGNVDLVVESISPMQTPISSESPVAATQIPIDTPSRDGETLSFEDSPGEKAKAISEENLAAEIQAVDGMASPVKHTFSRAANLIRQSMDLDATCFLEIPQQERYKSLESLKSRMRQDRDGTDTDLSQDSTASTGQVSFDFMSPKTRGRGGPSSSADELFCHRLAFSTRTSSSLINKTISASHLTIPASLLSRLSLKYPQGRIFEYDSAGSITPRSASRSSTSEKSDSGKRKRLTYELLQYFPLARSLMFYPIYDNESRQLYAAYLGYTTNPARGLQKSELTYISGFTNSIMCEVMRLKAEATDNAKSDFISSISHELRSPLHGILASSQLLLESQLRPKQTEFLKMIETCARTLLDVMDHLLDYAKINHFVKRRSTNGSKKSTERENSDAYSLVSALNLLAVVEETTASMAVSHNRNWHSKESIDGSIWPETSALASVSPLLPIILNISPRDRWYFNTEAGSWRRILLNLVGNSIKYTQQGYIKVELQIRRSSEHGEKRVAELKVSDTGQGISREYLKHKLFTAFAQENNLSVGAGLGLSLVRKIVSALRGHIDIKSEAGVGTEVTVLIPVEDCDSDFYLQAGKSDLGIGDFPENKKICLLGFDVDDPVENAPTREPELRKAATSALKASLKSLVTDHYGFSLVAENPDILILEESYLMKTKDEYDTQERDLLIVDFDGKSRSKDQIKQANYVHLSLPIGPLKLSKALKSLFEERDRRTAQSVEERSVPVREEVPIRPGPSIPPAGPQELRSLSTPPTTTVQRAPPSITISQLAPTSASNILPADARPKRAILLVDDNAINLRILTAAVSRLNLQAQGTSILSAMNGLEAVNAFTAATNEGITIPIVFMDISMPVMDGCTAARKIRAFEEENGIDRQHRSTIIAITGLASAEAQTEIENSGFDVYLRKPVGVKTVREIVTADMAKNAPD